MEEKKYLKWYNIVGYGSGDIAGNVVYAFLTSFVMVYLTDTVGLASGIVGTLIAVSKLFDGFTDVFFGSLIDKTHSRLGKARPWMIYGYIGCAITLVACFAVPAGMGKAAQYTWFFIAYTLLNGVFYTANNIAYSALTSLITKNSKERVQMGSYRFIFAFSTSLLIQTITVGFVDWCGGDAAAWRLVAIIYAIVGLVVNTISGLSVKELPEEELNDGEPKKTEEKYSLVQAVKLLIKNKYYIMICGTYILQQLYSAMSVFGNVGFMGIPIVTSIYTENGMLYICVFTIIDQLMLWTAGVRLTSGTDSQKNRFDFRKLINPVTVSIFLAVICVLTGIRLPEVLNNSLQKIGQTATPLAMIYLGGVFTCIDVLKNIRRLDYYGIVILKMLLFPLFFYVLLGYLPVSSDPASGHLFRRLRCHRWGFPHRLQDRIK